MQSQRGLLHDETPARQVGKHPVHWRNGAGQAILDSHQGEIGQAFPDVVQGSTAAQGVVQEVQRRELDLTTVLGGLRVRAVSSALTFVAVSLCWVVFRSESLGAALAMYRTLLGFPVVPGGVEAPAGLFANGYFVSCMSFVPLAAAAIVVFAFPTSREFTAGRQDGSRPWLSWAPTPLWAALLAALGFFCLVWSWTPAPFIF